VPEKKGTGAPRGVFPGPGRDTVEPGVPTPTEPQALQALEARGTALLLGMLSRLQRVEGLLRVARVETLTATETIRTTVLDNEEATLEIQNLEEKLSEATTRILDLTVIIETFKGDAEAFLFDSKQLIFGFIDEFPFHPISAKWLQTLNVLNQALNILRI